MGTQAVVRLGVGHAHLGAGMKTQRDDGAAVLESGILNNGQGEMRQRKGIAGLQQYQ